MVVYRGIEGVQVVIVDIPDITDKEIRAYIDEVVRRKGHKPVKLQIDPCGQGEVTLSYDLRGPKFERIRRITGYLVGTIDRWNNAKQAEEHDRVKHIRV